MSEIISGNLYNKLANLLLFINAGDTSACTSILKNMDDEYSRKILDTIAETDTVEKGSINDIIDQFFSMAVDKEMLYGGKQISSKIFQETYGNMPDYINQSNNPFAFLQNVEDKTLIEFFKNDSLQFNAMILNFLPKNHVANLLKVYDDKTRGILSERMLSVKEIHPQIIKLYSQKLNDYFTSSKTKIKQEKDNQYILLARALESMKEEDREKILEFIKHKDPKKAKKLEYYMFTFEDFIHIPSSELIKIITRIRNMEHLAISLSGKSKTLIQKFKGTLSERGQLRLDLDIEKADQRQDIEEQIECRLKLIDIARELEEKRVIEPLYNYKGAELDEENDQTLSSHSVHSEKNIETPTFGELQSEKNEETSDFLEEKDTPKNDTENDNDAGLGQFNHKILAPQKEDIETSKYIKSIFEIESKNKKTNKNNFSSSKSENLIPYKEVKENYINPKEIDAKGSLTDHLTKNQAKPLPFKIIEPEKTIYEEVNQEKDTISLIEDHIKSNRFNQLTSTEDILKATIPDPEPINKKGTEFKKLMAPKPEPKPEPEPEPEPKTIKDKVIKNRTKEPHIKLVRKEGSKILQSKKELPKKDKKTKIKNLDIKVIRSKKRKK